MFGTQPGTECWGFCFGVGGRKDPFPEKPTAEKLGGYTTSPGTICVLIVLFR